jgi:hypothetical protein
LDSRLPFKQRPFKFLEPILVPETGHSGPLLGAICTVAVIKFGHDKTKPGWYKAEAGTGDNKEGTEYTGLFGRGSLSKPCINRGP